MDHLEIDIKHYDKYMKSLTTFAKSMGLKVIYRSEPCDGVFIPTKRVIALDKDLSQAGTLAVFLHELGHAIQHYFGTYAKMTESEKSRINLLYSSASTKKSNKKYLYEKEAWVLGSFIAYCLKIKLGTWYNKTAKYYLQSHSTATTLRR